MRSAVVIEETLKHQRPIKQVQKPGVIFRFDQTQQIYCDAMAKYGQPGYTVQDRALLAHDTRQ